MSKMMKAALVVAVSAGVLAWSGAATAQELTVFGAEKAGNGGDIPAWTGGIKASTGSPAKLSNPFSGDAPRLVIDASNVDQHASKLSAGQVAMIKRYPDSYKIPVYQTRRTFANPGWVYDAIRSEAGGVSTVEDRGLAGLNLSTVAFPKPKNGLEAIWNHVVRYRSPAFKRRYVQA
ncbi:MAG: DUF1329 domain-containing protein, partial [Pseudomonadota bacterium]